MLLRVRNLATQFFLDEGVLKAVDDVSFDVAEEETVALVGESGCGKTIVALSIIDLVALPGRIVKGRVLFNDQDLLRAAPEELRKVRGGEIGMVFQEPGAALNPVYTVGYQIAEVLQEHRGLTRHEADAETIRLLGETGSRGPWHPKEADPPDRGASLADPTDPWLPLRFPLSRGPGPLPNGGPSPRAQRDEAPSGLPPTLDLLVRPCRTRRGTISAAVAYENLWICR
jgi:hypothetical protein